MTHSPKILMVINDMAWFWSHRLPLAHGILEKKWPLIVAAHSASNDQKLTSLGVKGVELGRHGSIIGEIKLLLSLFKSFQGEKSDLIHAITLRHAFYTGFVTRILGQKKRIFTLAGLGSLFSSETFPSKIMRFFITPLFKFSFGGHETKIIFQNPDDLNAFVNAKIINEKNAVLIKSSGVDLQKFTLSPLPKNKKPIILFSSRLIEEKGINDFVEAARILKDKASFQVAGDIYPQNPKSLTRDQIQHWHDEGVVEWLGQVDDMPAVMKACDIFVLPSYYREGVPRVTLEAMASGRPVITCDTPGCRETVDDGITGFLIPPKNPHALAKAIEKMLSDRTAMDAMGEAAREKAETEFSVESVVTRTLDVYDKVLKG